MTEQLIADRIALARGLLGQAFNAMDNNDSRKLVVLDAWQDLRRVDRTVCEDIGGCW